jgi:acyl transferase domain-containing protein
MSCIFPGAPEVVTYWQNILRSVEGIGDPPDDWEAARVLDPASHANDRVYVSRGGWLGPLAQFDPIRHGVMPNAVGGGEPDQFLALEAAHAALTDAGYFEHPVDGAKVSVILGRGTYVNRGISTVLQHGVIVDRIIDIVDAIHPFPDSDARSRLKTELKSTLPAFNADTVPGLVPNIIASRIANRMDFRGDSFIVDAACASSLIAVQRGVQDLRAGRCDMAIVGGVHASTPAPIAMIFCQLGALSRRGKLQPFDRDADGTLLGEGVGILVLKRLSDAEKAGDRIYALLKGVGIASDGRAAGLLVPRLEGQELAMRRALEDGDVSPHTIGLIEAHGTGTPIGDRTELDAMTRVYAPRPDGMTPIALGSVKSMIGHLMPAAGAAGLIKVALALYHRVLPPTLPSPNPLPELVGEATSFSLNTDARPWIHAGPSPRRAAVSAFGFGGINAHAVLEEYGTGEACSLQKRWPTELFILTAVDRDALIKSAQRLQSLIEAREDIELPDLAFTLAKPLHSETLRLAIVASSVPDFAAKLKRATDCLRDPTRSRLRLAEGVYFAEDPLVHSGTLAFLFPGEGAQHVGMMAELCMHFTVVRRWFDLIEAACMSHMDGPAPSQLIFPSPGTIPLEAIEERLSRSAFASPTIFAASQGLLCLFDQLGIIPQAVVGHSTGEYSALLAAGVNPVLNPKTITKDISDLAAIFRKMRHEGKVPAAAMLAVNGVERERIDSILSVRHDIAVAMENCAQQVVLCGPDASIAEVAEALRLSGAICLLLPMRHAYHTAAFAPFRDRYLEFLKARPIDPPRIPLWSCATAAPYPNDPETIRAIAADQWESPVRFRETIVAMHQNGVRIFLECGPRNILTAFVGDILRGRPHLAVAPDTPARTGVTGLHHCLAALAAHGLPMSLDPLHRGRRLQLIDLDHRRPTPRPVPPLATNLQSLRLATSQRKSALPTSLDPRADPPASVAQPLQAPGRLAQSTLTNTETIMRSYLANMDSFLSLQHQIMATTLAGPLPNLSTAPRRLPLVGRHTYFEPGRFLVAIRQIHPQHDPYIVDHTIGRQISALDPALTGLPLVPFTVTIEMMAEVAAALAPDEKVVAIEDLSAHRWIALAHGAMEIEQRAERRTSDGRSEVQVGIFERIPDGDNPEVRCLAEGTVVLASQPLPEADSESSDPGVTPPPDFYGEKMFHGPRLQGVAAVERIDEAGIEVQLRTLPTNDLFAASDAPEFVLDPILLDAAGQALGYWCTNRLGIIIFPFRLDRVVLHAKPLPAGRKVYCSVHVIKADDWSVRCDMVLTGRNGRRLADLVGWQARCFALPEAFRLLRSEPFESRLCEDWDNPAPGAVLCRLDLFDDDFLSASGGIWENVLAHLILSARERKSWTGYVDCSIRRDWLRRRCVAKEAVRAVLRERYAFHLPPADIEFTQEDGRLSTRGSRRNSAEYSILTTVACASGRYVALAASGAEFTELGLALDFLPQGTPAPPDLEARAISAARVQPHAEFLIKTVRTNDLAAAACLTLRGPT